MDKAGMKISKPLLKLRNQKHMDASVLLIGNRTAFIDAKDPNMWSNGKSVRERFCVMTGCYNKV